jgi:hypothetical protein
MLNQCSQLPTFLYKITYKNYTAVGKAEVQDGIISSQFEHHESRPWTLNKYPISSTPAVFPCMTTGQLGNLTLL